MKKKSYILKIENPCSQDWTLMTPNEAGKFCSHCSKTVVDFTYLSDQQIIEFVQQNSGKLCGRLTSQQNNRTFIPAKERHNTPAFYKFLSGLLLFGTAQNSLATTKTVPTEIVESIDDNEILLEENRVQESDSLKNVVKGKVIDADTKEAVPFAYVGIKDTEIHTATNTDGEFQFEIPEKYLTDKIFLIVAYVGYERTEISFDKKDLSTIKKLVIVQMPNVLLGEVEIIEQKKWWQFWKKKN